MNYSWGIKENVEKNVTSCDIKEFFWKILDPLPDPDLHRDLIGSSLICITSFHQVSL